MDSVSECSGSQSVAGDRELSCHESIGFKRMQVVLDEDLSCSPATRPNVSVIQNLLDSIGPESFRVVHGFWCRLTSGRAFPAGSLLFAPVRQFLLNDVHDADISPRLVTVEIRPIEHQAVHFPQRFAFCFVIDP